MGFYAVIEFLTGLALVVIVGTQVVWPLWRDTPLFPVFRGESRLMRRLRGLRQEEVELKLQRQVELEEKILEAQRKASDKMKES